MDPLALFLRMVYFCFAKCTNIARYYLDDRLLRVHNTELEPFLNQFKHEIFHRWITKIPCCQCNNGFSLAASYKKEKISEMQIKSLYRFDGPSTPGHEVQGTHNVVKQHCICNMYAIKCITSQELDILLIIQVIKSCNPSLFTYELGTIRKTRNELAHNVQCGMTEDEFDSKWKDLEAACIALAQKISTGYERNVRSEILGLMHMNVDILMVQAIDKNDIVQTIIKAVLEKSDELKGIRHHQLVHSQKLDEILQEVIYIRKNEPNTADMSTQYSETDIVIREKKFLRLVKFYNIALDVVRNFTEKYLLKNYQSLHKFLVMNKHTLYHLWEKNLPCCACVLGEIPVQKERARLDQNEIIKLFDTNGNSKPGHVIKYQKQFLVQKCMCRVSVLSHVSLDDLDIMIMYKLLRTYTEINYDDRRWINVVIGTRNALSDTQSTTDISERELDQLWQDLTPSVLGMARKIPMTFYARTIGTLITTLKKEEFKDEEVDDILEMYLKEFGRRPTTFNGKIRDQLPEVSQTPNSANIFDNNSMWDRSSSRLGSFTSGNGTEFTDSGTWSISRHSGIGSEFTDSGTWSISRRSSICSNVFDKDVEERKAAIMLNKGSNLTGRRYVNDSNIGIPLNTFK